MAEVYEQYLKNEKQIDVTTRQDSREFGKDLIGVAMDQVHLLQGVVRRVAAFVDAYEKWDALDPSYQVIRGLPFTEGEPDPILTFDDLKILLDKFPQKDF